MKDQSWSLRVSAPNAPSDAAYTDSSLKVISTRLQTSLILPHSPANPRHFPHSAHPPLLPFSSHYHHHHHHHDLPAIHPLFNTPRHPREHCSRNNSHRPFRPSLYSHPPPTHLQTHTQCPLFQVMFTPLCQNLSLQVRL